MCSMHATINALKQKKNWNVVSSFILTTKIPAKMRQVVCTYSQHIQYVFPIIVYETFLDKVGLMIMLL